MNIGIDVDGVMQDCENYFRAFAELYDIDYIHKGVKNTKAPRIQERMAWSDEEFQSFVNGQMLDIMKSAPLMPAVQEVIKRLKKMGHRLVVITARGTFCNEEIGILHKVLKKNKLKFDKVCVNAGKKLDVCLEEKIDYMIDDSSGNVKCLSENGIKCLYYRRMGTVDVKNENVTQVLNWGEIYRFFWEIENKK
jgi:uncharacterized HAD superfamily protein